MSAGWIVEKRDVDTRWGPDRLVDGTWWPAIDGGRSLAEDVALSTCASAPEAVLLLRAVALVERRPLVLRLRSPSGAVVFVLDLEGPPRSGAEGRRVAVARAVSPVSSEAGGAAGTNARELGDTNP